MHVWKRLLLAINAGRRCDRPKRGTRGIVKRSDPQADLLACIRHSDRYRFEVLKQLVSVGPAVYGQCRVVKGLGRRSRFFAGVSGVFRVRAGAGRGGWR